jgi:hypothetical protein
MKIANNRIIEMMKNRVCFVMEDKGRNIPTTKPTEYAHVRSYKELMNHSVDCPFLCVEVSDMNKLGRVNTNIATSRVVEYFISRYEVIAPMMMPRLMHRFIRHGDTRESIWYPTLTVSPIAKTENKSEI